jgi:hypothetical protein
MHERKNMKIVVFAESGDIPRIFPFFQLARMHTQFVRELLKRRGISGF